MEASAATLHFRDLDTGVKEQVLNLDALGWRTNFGFHFFDPEKVDPRGSRTSQMVSMVQETSAQRIIHDNSVGTRLFSFEWRLDVLTGKPTSTATLVVCDIPRSHDNSAERPINDDPNVSRQFLRGPGVEALLEQLRLNVQAARDRDPILCNLNVTFSYDGPRGQ